MRQLILVIGFTAAFFSSLFLQAAERRIVGSQGMDVFLQDGISCGQKMNIIARSPNKNVFSGDRVELARAMGGARAVLSLDCPQVETLYITGKAGAKQVFSGYMSQEDNWNLVDLDAEIKTSIEESEKSIKESKRLIDKTVRLSEENVRLADEQVKWAYDHAIVLSDGRHVFFTKDGSKLFDHKDNEITDRASIEEARRISGIADSTASRIDSTNSDVLLKMADRYSYGKGIHRNYAEATKLYMKAAEAGNAEAQYKLAVSLDKGFGIQPDAQQSMYWFRQAANQGHTGAMNNIGLMYEEGRGVQQSYSEAIKWYSMAAERGNDMAQYNLGVAYEDGKGVPKDMGLAVQYFRMAANQGMKEAQQMLRRIERSGKVYNVKQSVDQNRNKQYTMSSQNNTVFILSNGKRGNLDKGKMKFITEDGEVITDKSLINEARRQDLKPELLGERIYKRAFGRGCGVCHETAANPNLSANIKTGTLDRRRFESIIRTGKGNMPKSMDAIMNPFVYEVIAPFIIEDDGKITYDKPVLLPVKEVGYSETQVIDALWAYLSNK